MFKIAVEAIRVGRAMGYRVKAPIGDFTRPDTHAPVQLGLRFSAKALGPSMKSSDAITIWCSL